MIIVEGPDGSGKDTLIETMFSDPNLRPHLVKGPRAVKSSQQGPVDHLGAWMVNDYRQWELSESCRVYNRYPLISEPIYGPRIRGSYQPGFQEVERHLTPLISRDALVILCLPPFDIAWKNVSESRDMPGVVEHYQEIYNDYLEGVLKGWPGWLIRYDYTQPETYRQVVFSVLTHVRERMRDGQR